MMRRFPDPENENPRDQPTAYKEKENSEDTKRQEKTKGGEMRIPKQKRRHILNVFFRHHRILASFLGKKEKEGVDVEAFIWTKRQREREG